MKQSTRVLAFALALVAGLAVGAFATSMLAAQDTYEGPQWEYLTLEYSQEPVITSEAGAVPELVVIDRLEYAELMAESSMQCVELSDPAEQTECLDERYRGRGYYLDLLGSLGWELIALEKQTTQYSYSVEMIFKRPTVSKAGEE